MDKLGPIVIIDDDSDDLEIFSDALKQLELKNKVLLFNDGDSFLTYMRTTEDKVFFILCDINMPIKDGFDLQNEIYNDRLLSGISIPFIFFSTSGDINYITKAYSKPIQGYFTKPASFEEMKDMFSSIIKYWEYSFHPSVGAETKSH